jgi:hypothetical protein
MTVLAALSAVGLTAGVCCVDRKQPRFSAVLRRSDGVGEFGEDRWEPIPSVDIYAEFVVAAA